MGVTDYSTRLCNIYTNSDSRISSSELDAAAERWKYGRGGPLLCRQSPLWSGRVGPLWSSLACCLESIRVHPSTRASNHHSLSVRRSLPSSARVSVCVGRREPNEKSSRCFSR